MSDRNSLVFVMAFIVIGSLVFYSIANFDSRHWQHAYGLWDKLKDLLLVATVYWAVKPRAWRQLVYPVYLLLMARCCWEVISWATGWGINSHWAVSWGFIGCCLAVAVYCLILMKKNL